jgi:capsule polysaccharide export protein KpsE/RkpR
MNLFRILSRTKSSRTLLGGAVGAVIMVLASLCLSNVYTSEALLLPGEGRSQSSLGSLSMAAAALGFGSPVATENASNVETFDYTRRPWPFNLFPAKAHGTLQAYYGKVNLDHAVRALRVDLKASRDLKDNVIHVSMDSTSPDLSQQVVQSALHQLEYFIKNKAQTRGGAKAAYSRDRLRDAEGEYDKANQELQDFMSGNLTYQVSGNPAVRLRGARLEAQLALRRQVVATLTLAAEQAVLEEKDDTPVLTILDPGNLPLEKSRPSRSFLVILGFLFGALGSAGWNHRNWIREQIVKS